MCTFAPDPLFWPFKFDEFFSNLRRVGHRNTVSDMPKVWKKILTVGVPKPRENCNFQVCSEQFSRSFGTPTVEKKFQTFGVSDTVLRCPTRRRFEKNSSNLKGQNHGSGANVHFYIENLSFEVENLSFEVQFTTHSFCVSTFIDFFQTFGVSDTARRCPT